MIVVKSHDKRHNKGTRLDFFDTDEVTHTIVAFVRNHTNVYMISTNEKIYNRAGFLREFTN